MEFDQKNEIDQGLGVPNLIWNFANRFTTMAKWKFFELKKITFLMPILHWLSFVSTGNWL